MSSTKKILYEQVGGYLKGENQQSTNAVKFYWNNYETPILNKSFSNTFRPRRIIPREIDDYNQACKIEYTNYGTYCTITINTGLILSNYTTQQLRILRNTKRIEKILQPNEWVLLKVGKINNTIELIVETNVQLKATNYFVSNDYYYVWLCAFVTKRGVNTFYDWTYATNVSDLVTSNGYTGSVGITQTFHHGQNDYRPIEVVSGLSTVSNNVAYSKVMIGAGATPPNLRINRSTNPNETTIGLNVSIGWFLMVQSLNGVHWCYFKPTGDGKNYQMMRIVNNPTTFTPTDMRMCGGEF